MTVKVIAEFVNVLSDDMPGFPIEQAVKAMLKPSGPGALSLGRSRITASISSLLNGRQRLSKELQGCMSQEIKLHGSLNRDT